MENAACWSRCTSLRGLRSSFGNFEAFLILSFYDSTWFLLLWSRIQDLVIWKSINQQQKIRFWLSLISPMLLFYESTQFCTYGTIFRICTVGNQRSNSNNNCDESPIERAAFWWYIYVSRCDQAVYRSVPLSRHAQKSISKVL